MRSTTPRGAYGIDNDPRGRDKVEQSLALARRRYEQLPDYLKEVFDDEELTNPYVDTRVYVGDPDADVKSVIGGIDMNVGEVLLADRLREKGTPIDAIYTHHPEGMALTKLDKVMAMQAEEIVEGFRRADQHRRGDDGRAPYRGEAALHAHERRPGDRRGAAA